MWWPAGVCRRGGWTGDTWGCPQGGRLVCHPQPSLFSSGLLGLGVYTPHAPRCPKGWPHLGWLRATLLHGDLTCTTHTCSDSSSKQGRLLRCWGEGFSMLTQQRHNSTLTVGRGISPVLRGAAVALGAAASGELGATPQGADSLLTSVEHSCPCPTSDLDLGGSPPGHCSSPCLCHQLPALNSSLLGTVGGVSVS